MARVICRRRPDGIDEIVPPTALQRFLSDFESAFVAMALVCAVAVSGALYAAFGVPVVLVLGGVMVGWLLWRRDHRGTPPVAPRAGKLRRNAG